MARYMNAHLRKLIGRNDIKISLAVFFALPLLLAFLISIKSGIIQVGNTKFGGLAYAAIVIEMLKSIFLIHVMLAIFASTFIGGEIDSGVDAMYMAKAPRRPALIATKLGALSMVAALVFATAFAAAVVGWFVFLRPSSYGEEAFLTKDADANLYLALALGRALLEMVCMAAVFGLLALFFSQNKALVLSFVCVAGMKLLSNWRLARNFIPTYIGSSNALTNLEGSALLREGLTGAALLLAYTALLYAVSTVRYNRMDLARTT